MRRKTNAGSILGHRLRSWPNIKPASFQRIVYLVWLDLGSLIMLMGSSSYVVLSCIGKTTVTIDFKCTQLLLFPIY